MNKLRHASLAGAAITVMMLTAACGGGEKAAEDDYGKAPAGSSSKIGDGYASGSGGYGSGGASGSAAADKNAPAKQLAVREAPGIGPVVADGKGLTLYRFDKDTAKPPASRCDGDCAKAWPPVPADDASATAGLDAELGEVKRADGTMQLTLAGWPVYRYAKDAAPGDTKGQGVGGTWSAFAPDGKKAGAAGGDEGKDGKDGKDGKGGQKEEEQEGGKEKQPEEEEPAADGVLVKDNPTLGKILVDGQGRTLYRFNKDSAWPMKFACNDACLDTWKPAKPVEKSAVRGVPEKLITTVTRPDGTKQLAVDCWPVYWFTGDKKAGDITGQGKQGLWFAVDDQGKKVTTPAS
ncbi:SCO0930 family lipoprotein [Streptomyces syringium]|uniref:SCO0930 family lipoprotein n=1 Tax=Streptomyces syringium TaxID=76729 RepID=UPI0033EE451B